RVGSSGRADGDWVALARARIEGAPTAGGPARFDFLQHFERASIDPEPGTDYHTPGNVPVFPYRAWLEQEPAKVLLDRRDFSPSPGIRLLDAGSHAGFWGMHWGMLPFAFADADSPLESIAVYQVIRQVDGYGEANPVWGQ
ncbi:MAG: hypothetical protein WAO20_14630, partial [Acidobacteriota bacterium]